MNSKEIKEAKETIKERTERLIGTLEELEDNPNNNSKITIAHWNIRSIMDYLYDFNYNLLTEKEEEE